MLVLTRRLDEQIRIGDDINVMVVRIDRDKVRLGVAAPLEIPIVREELLAGGPIIPPRCVSARDALCDARGYVIASGGRNHPWGQRVLGLIDAALCRRKGGAA